MSFPRPDCFETFTWFRLSNFLSNSMSQRQENKLGDAWKTDIPRLKILLLEQRIAKREILRILCMQFFKQEISPAINLSSVLIHCKFILNFTPLKVGRTILRTIFLGLSFCKFMLSKDVLRCCVPCSVELGGDHQIHFMLLWLCKLHSNQVLLSEILEHWLKRDDHACYLMSTSKCNKPHHLGISNATKISMQLRIPSSI